MNIHVVLLSIFVTIALTACSGDNAIKSDLGMADAPDWVNEGTQILENKQGRLFHGIGSAPDLGDQSLQISTADNRARAEIARILSSYVKEVSQDYVASGKAQADGYSEQSMSRQINQTTNINLTGARIIGHWRDPESGTIYSIAEMDLEKAKQIVRAVDDMNQGLDRYVNEQGGHIFDRLIRENKL